MFRPSPEMFFDRIDRDGDGRIGGDELEETSGFFRGMLDRAGVREGSSREDFTRGFERMREERERESRDDDDERRDGDDRDRSRSGPSYYKPAERSRVTIDLPEDYSDRDQDGDGQIGLYEWREWDRGRIDEFYWLDLNGDGFLTPKEIAAESGEDPDEDDSRNGRSRSSASGRSSNSLDENDPEVRRARQYFGLLDRNRDGQVNPDEWSASRRLKPAFEQANVPLDRDMPADEFVRNYVRVIDE